MIQHFGTHLRYRQQHTSLCSYLLFILSVATPIYSFTPLLTTGTRGGFSSLQNNAPSKSTTMATRNDLQFAPCEPSDVESCFSIEEASYPPDEAASLSQLKYRQSQAQPFFRVCRRQQGGGCDDMVLGFVCGTLCRRMTEESMSTHDPQGNLLAIHSVVVEASHRRKGVATAMLQDYLDTIRTDHPHLHKVVLLAKAYLLPFYVSAGFTVVRPSPIVHGQEQWFDLEMDLGLSYSIMDAFVVNQQAGSGNPAAIVVLPRDYSADDAWLQRVAREFNLSETAFLWPTSKEPEFPAYRIRYFSPQCEVDLCGHATLVATAALGRAEEVTFTANHGIELCAQYDLTNGSVTMKFPSQPVTPLTDAKAIQSVHIALQESMKLQPDQDIVYLGIASGLGDLFVHITEEAMDRLGSTLNTDLLTTCSNIYQRGVIICCDRVREGVVASRFFAPLAGIAEDPVTGSAHCALVPYFCARRNAEGKESVTRITARQESPRGGAIDCTLEEDGNIVALTGQVLLTMEGRLRM